MDLMAAIDEPLVMAAGGRTIVPTGISIALPSGYECQVRPRSGLAAKNGVTVLNSPGTIDADYREKVILSTTVRNPLPSNAECVSRRWLFPAMNRHSGISAKTLTKPLAGPAALAQQG